MNYIRFFLNNKRLISFGFFLAFFSSFGQTFLISLYVPDIMREFRLNSFSFGLMYGGATIMSGMMLAHAGQFIDRCNLRNYTLLAVFLLVLSCFFIAFSPHLIYIFIGFWGLRFSGQGLLSHISNTSISKYFHKTRGVALSLSALGYSLGEAFLPITIGLLIGYIGWRNSMVLNAGLIAFILAPFVYFALNDKKIHYHFKETDENNAHKFSRSRLLKDKSFYIIAFNSFILPSTITGLFFYQLILAQEKGWPVELLSISFLGFAIGRTIFSLISGKLIDKFSAMTLFPLYLIPFAVGLCVLAIFKHPSIALIYLTLTGISMGLSSTVNTALLAEVYGTRNLGGVRALFSTIMVLSTALSPALFGFLLDHDFNFTFISAGSLCLVILAISLSSRLPVLQKRGTGEEAFVKS